jgi:hypothetical protein
MRGLHWHEPALTGTTGAKFPEQRGLGMERKRIARYLTCLISLVLSCIASVPGASQTWGGDVDDIFSTMERLGISVPMSVAGRDPISRHLAELSREHCDQQAIADLGTALDAAGYRREAAGAHVGFSATCGGHAASLRAAVNIFLKLSDHVSAAWIATDLIKLEPYSDNGYFLRAVAYERGAFYQRAIDDYVTAIELFGNKDRISSVSYFSMARSYEKLGRFCDATSPIESWISLNPARNDTSQTQAMIADYMKKGNCALATGSEETFPVPRQHRPVTLPVTVNGTRGTFVLDTGASFVTLKKTFAQKAAVQIDQDSSVDSIRRTASATASWDMRQRFNSARCRPRKCRSWWRRTPKPVSATASTVFWD